MRAASPMSLRNGTFFAYTLALIACLAALAPGCKRTGTGGDAAGGKIKLQLNWKPEPQFGGFYAAEGTGAFKKQGLDVEIVPGAVGTPTVQMVGAGGVAFAV